MRRVTLFAVVMISLLPFVLFTTFDYNGSRTMVLQSRRSADSPPAVATACGATSAFREEQLLYPNASRRNILLSHRAALASFSNINLSTWSPMFKGAKETASSEPSLSVINVWSFGGSMARGNNCSHPVTQQPCYAVGMACDIVNEEMQRTNNSIYFRATNYARGGTDTSDATGILPQMLSRAPIKPDIIFIDFSVNDIHSIQNRPGAPSPSMPAEVLLDLVAMISPKSVVIFVIVGTFYINTPWLLRWHFARLRLLCSMRQVPIVDFRFACTATSHCLWTGSDVREYHPLYRVHRGMAETIADGLLRTFRRSVCLEGDLQEDFSEETHTLFTKEEKKELMRCVSPAHDISGYDPPSPWAINATAGGWSLLVERNVPAWTTTTVGANLSFNVRMADKAPLMIAVSSLCSYENAGIVKMHFPTDRKRPYPVATIDTHWADRFSGHCISWFLVSGGHRYLWGHQAQPGTVVPVVFEFVGARKEHVTRQAFFKLFSITSC